MKKTLVILMALLTFGCAETKPKVENRPMTYDFTKAEYEYAIAPQVYGILANRITNKMLDDTKTVYENLSPPFLYVMEIKKEDANLPDGFYYANKVTKEILKNSRTFRMVNNMNDADYFLETIVSTYSTSDSETPIIVYKMILFDNQNNKINEWAETIARVQNDDQSWW